MTLEQTLQKISLTEKEARAYLAALELGSATVLDIAKKSGLKRPTCYVLLDQLVAKGCVKKEPHEKKTLYSAEEPERLIALVKTQEEALKDALPLLLAIQAGKKEKPKISVHEGADGMRHVYEDIFSSTQIWWFASIRDINKSFSDVTKAMLEVSKKKKTHVHEILTPDPEDIAYAKSACADNYEIRIAPPEMPISIDMAIYQNKVAIFSIKRHLFATVLESDDIAESFRTFHQLAWASATPVEKFF